MIEVSITKQYNSTISNKTTIAYNKNTIIAIVHSRSCAL